MQNKIPFLIRWLDYILAFASQILLLFLVLMLTIGSDDTVGFYLLFAFMSLPVFIFFKIIGANEAWNRIAEKIALDIANNNTAMHFNFDNTVKGEAYLELPIQINAPHTYSEFRGGDSTQRLSSRNFTKNSRVSLSGIYEQLSEHEFYCNQSDRVEALSLYTPEVLELITNSKVQCAIETVDNRLKVYSYPGFFADQTELNKLMSLAKLLKAQIDQRSGSFNKLDKTFEKMPYRKVGFYLTNFTDQAKIIIMATTTMAVLTLLYASDSGSGRIKEPALDLPEWIGIIIFSFVMLSPILIVIAFLNLQTLSASIRKPVKTVKIGSTHFSRGVLIYFLVLAVSFSVILLSATDTIG